jgi:antitoxin MazE
MYTHCIYVLREVTVMATTVKKWGNSLGVRIPKAIADQVSLEDGTPVEFATTGGVLTIRPVRRQRRGAVSLKALLAKVKGPSPHRGFDRDGRAGRELL